MKCYRCKTEINEDGSPVKHYKCKKCQRETAKIAYGKNPDKFRKRKAEWKENNVEAEKQINAKWRKQLKIDTLNAYGGCKCVCCGETEIDFLCLDHINNNGKQDREIYGGGTSFYTRLKSKGFPQEMNLQVMCYNCNNSKKIHGICVHQIKN